MMMNHRASHSYDGWRVVQERDGDSTPAVSYTRGNDLSGSLEGAGGIGGLLARSQHSTTPTLHSYYHADGNGNITCLINGSQSVVASYRYDPFGNTISMSGSLANANTYRFSSKEMHVKSELYYYGYRFYDPSLQRWMNRDPLGEMGFESSLLRHSFVLDRPAEAVESPNLYEYVMNSPLNYADPFGNATSPMEWYKRCSALANISLEKGCECFCLISADTDGSCMRTCKNCYARKLDAEALCRCMLNEALEGTYAKEIVDAICSPLKCPPKKQPKIPDISIPNPPSRKPPPTPPPHRRP